MPRVTIESIAQGGDGVARLSDGRVLFVPRGLVGDELDVEIVRQKKTWARGRIRAVLSPGPGRVEPGCVHFDECGGCAFQHLSYDHEIAAKVGAAAETMRRIGKLELPEPSIHAADRTDDYRIRARLHCDGVRVGFRQIASHDVFALDHCRVLHPVLDAVATALQSALKGWRGEVAVECVDGAVVVDAPLLGSNRAREVLRLDSVCAVRSQDGTHGDFTISAAEDVGVSGTDLRSPAGRFRQANAAMAQRLRRVVSQRMEPQSRLIELFSGAGNLTFAVARQCERVDAWELSPEAVDAGNATARALGLDHVAFHCSDLMSATPTLDASVLLLDPPRTGASQVARAAVESPKVTRVIYVSCDAGTLARDLGTLSDGGFGLTSVDFIDMFPRTAHLETIAVLER